jgi:L-ascorbate metabolism protein UlaG (beta-lactamase superfamily)
MVHTLELPTSAPAGSGPTTGSVTFIGTATTLIRCGDITVLTDPNFLHKGQEAHLGYGLRSKRITDPAMEIGELPRLDLCVLSHLHGDHWDRIATHSLRKDLPIVTTRQAAATLRKTGFEATIPLERWEEVTITKGASLLRVTAMPAKRGPTFMSLALPSIMGSMLEWATAAGDVVYRLYITGDTLIFDALAEIRRRYPDIDLALLHLGGTRLFGVLLTMDADQGVQLLRMVEPGAAIPIHYNDYVAFKSPLEDFERAVEQAGLAHEVRYLAHGQAYDFDIAR